MCFQIHAALGQTKPVFEPGIHYNNNYSPVKICGCILHDCETILLTEFVFKQTDRHILMFLPSN